MARNLSAHTAATQMIAQPKSTVNTEIYSFFTGKIRIFLVQISKVWYDIMIDKF